MAEQDCTAEYLNDFPNLKKTGGCHRTSDPADYNCIAFAVWDEANWWWPRVREDEYWPLPIPEPDKVTIQTFIDAFISRGFSVCTPNGQPEAGYHKAAIFAKSNGEVTHAARLEDGMTSWKSKLGTGRDVKHALAGLEGDYYGHPVAFLKRPSNVPFPPIPPQSPLTPPA
jgi:hypothetical protein